ncbi:MAG: terpene cyclase/mutase family protein [Planctomycetes bacterium]|nr:terpene cyclase/mutase family protein [Planctomycetota bacterium]
MLLLPLLLAAVPQGRDPGAPDAGRLEAGPPSAARVAESSAEAWCPPQRAARCSAAAARGLAWLAEQQLDAGCWTGIIGHKMQSDYIELDQALAVGTQRRTGHGHLGVTALAGMAFLAGGHLPGRGLYGEVVERTNDYVVGCTLESGLLTDAGTRMYSHAFATLFLAEIHGMAVKGERKSALERAVHMIVDSQNEVGGWRYNPFDRATDLSVTVCQLQALRAAHNIGIHVPSDTIERAMAYVRKSRVPRGSDQGLFYYKIYGPGAYDKPSEYAINAAALTAMSSAGVYDAELSDPVLTFLERSYGGVADYWGDHYFFYYGNYYAAQGFFQQGGPRLKAFYTRLSDDLLRAQRPDGRWENRVGPGDEFSTAVACILLQMPRQYLPIFQR